MNNDILDKINEVLELFFKENAEVNCVALKNIMPQMVEKGVFTKDIRKGLPLRKILRALDKEGILTDVPLAYAHKTEQDIYWYFRRPDTDCDLIQEKTEPTKKELAQQKHEASDEYYILGLCDDVLKIKSSRQHRFRFLVGYLHKDKQTRTMLPLDAFYEKHSLVIEFDPKRFEEGEDEKLDRKTNSGVSRRKQREVYDARKKDVLSDRGIEMLRIPYSAFNIDEDGKIIREEEGDLKIIKDFISQTKRLG